MNTHSVSNIAEHRDLNKKDYKTLSLAALGGALEFYDFVIFVFFAVVIGQLFFPPDMPEWLRQFQTFGIFAAGYLARPLGGIIMAHFGDMIGRKRMFTVSIILMALPTLFMGLLPTYATIGIAAPILLLALRILQGAAIGGEVPGAWVFVSEHVPDRHVGFANGTLTSGLTCGILLGALIAAAINYNFTAEEVAQWAWRIPFLIGGVFGIFAIYLRRYLEETPVFTEMKERKALSKEMPLKSVLKSHKPAVVVSMLVTWILSAAIVVVVLMTPTFLQKIYQIDAVTSLMANSLAIVALMIGAVLAGIIADRLGSGITFLIGSVLLGASSTFFYANLSVGMPLSSLYVNYTITGLCVGIVGAVPYVMIRAFPASIRFTGLSFSYNVAYAIFGGLTPMIVSYWMKLSPMAPAYYVASLCVLGFAIGLYLLSQNKSNSEPVGQPQTA